MPQHVYILTEEEYKVMTTCEWKDKYEEMKEKRIDEAVSYVDTLNALRNQIQNLEREKSNMETEINSYLTNIEQANESINELEIKIKELFNHE